MKSVFIVSSNGQYDAMFKGQGWDVVNDIDKADLVQFTGGADVSPHLYGEAVHPSTGADGNRDDNEKSMFLICQDLGIPMAGICRGGQFLNVMSGGSMWQHVNNHAIWGTHEVFDLWTNELYQATSTHHQMMRASHDAVVVAVGQDISTFRTEMVGEVPTQHDVSGIDDQEVLWYPKTRCLCFQPHPEYDEGEECRVHYFNYINEYIFEGDV